MKIAVSSTGQDLNALVDARFGRCQYFVIVDPETMEFEAAPNPSLSAMHGAGIQTAQMIASKGVSMVLTGNCGSNAFQTLSSAGIGVIVGATGTVRDAVEKYTRGELQPSSQASVQGHFGMVGTGPASPAGPGTGTSFGMGRGRGAGRGMGRGMMRASFQAVPAEPQPLKEPLHP